MPHKLNLLDTEANTAIKTNLEKVFITTDNNERFFLFTCGYIVFITALQP